MNLVIDIGNSFIKLAIFNNYEIISTKQYSSDKTEFIYSVFNEHAGIENGIISITGKSDPDLLNFISKQLGVFIILDENTSLPIENLYQTKETLGKQPLLMNLLMLKHNIWEVAYHLA